jgi:hypothetical protein
MMNSSNELKEIRAESFWGSVAALFLIQVFGYIVYQGFIFHFFKSSFGFFSMIWGGGWLLAFILFQNITFGVIYRYVFSQQKKLVLPGLNNYDDVLKLFLAAIFLFVFIAFIFGYYPFEKAESNHVYEAGFFTFSWSVSFLMKKSTITNLSVATGGSRLMGFIVGLVFFIIGIIEGPLFYFPGMIGAGVCTMMLSAWLMEDQIK